MATLTAATADPPPSEQQNARAQADQTRARASDALPPRRILPALLPFHAPSDKDAMTEDQDATASSRKPRTRDPRRSSTSQAQPAAVAAASAPPEPIPPSTGAAIVPETVEATRIVRPVRGRATADGLARRRAVEGGLPRGQRWKRRLPRWCR